MSSDVASPAPVLILGARSDIARAIAHCYAKAGRPIQLAARDPEALERDRSDIEIRFNVKATTHAYDALDLAGLPAFFDALPETPGVVVQAVGYLGDQATASGDPTEAAHVVATNFVGPAAALEEAARRMEARGGPGLIVGISSVAGDRGRAKNYWYGGAKAGFTAMLSGLRQRLAKTQIHVMTVKPGFVATRMTEGMDLPGPLTDKPEAIAERIWKAGEARANIYTPWKWRLVMGVIGNLPEPIFKKTSF